MNQRDSLYVGPRMWKVLSVAFRYAPDSLPVGVLRREAYPLDGSHKGRLCVDALLERGMLEWTCPAHSEHPGSVCRARITERGMNARLDQRGRSAAG